MNRKFQAQKKLQIPSSKFQKSSKSRNPKEKPRAAPFTSPHDIAGLARVLELGAYLELGIWSLELLFEL